MKKRTALYAALICTIITGEYGRDGKRGDSSDTGRDDGASYH